MSCGIYLLSFNNTSKVYIGQSLNIEDRFRRHLWQFTVGSNSKKLTMAFTLYGIPSLEIEEVCEQSCLNDRENYYIQLWDSVKNGFNTYDASRGSSSQNGEYNGMSKFTNSQIQEAFYLLVLGELSNKEISIETGVSLGILRHISSGIAHTWLEEEYPVEFALLMSKKNTRGRSPLTAKERGIHLPQVLAPDGSKYTINNIREFSRQFNLDQSHLSSLLKGVAKSHKGWKLA